VRGARPWLRAPSRGGPWRGRRPGRVDGMAWEVGVPSVEGGGPVSQQLPLAYRLSANGRIAAQRAQADLGQLCNRSLDEADKRKRRGKSPGVSCTCREGAIGGDQRFENWKDLRALARPYFLRSTTRGSRVRKPAALTALRRAGSNFESA